MRKHKKYIPHEVHFFFAMSSLGSSLVLIWNQFFNSDEILKTDITGYMAIIVTIILVLATVFHIFEGIQEKK